MQNTVNALPHLLIPTLCFIYFKDSKIQGTELLIYAAHYITYYAFSSSV